MTVDLERPLHVCPDCGCTNDAVQRALGSRDEIAESMREDVANLERDLRSKRARIKALQKDQDAALRREPLYDAGMEVLKHWQAVCAPKSRELGGKRLELCIARLNGGYPPHELKRSCDGYALKPFVVSGGKRHHEGPKDAWRADAELIFRDAAHVDQGLRIMDRADDLLKVLAPEPAPPEPGELPGLSPLGAAALRMASHGFFVFPCQERDKVPATRNGFNGAKRDPDAIRACWAARPLFNVAIRTGASSGIVVLDVDGDEGWDSLHKLEDGHAPLPTTLSVTTPRGGQHFYFQHPGVPIGNTVGYPAAALDIRGDGGYVLAPPSIGPGGRKYEVDEQAAIADAAVALGSAAESPVAGGDAGRWRPRLGRVHLRGIHQR